MNAYDELMTKYQEAYNVTLKNFQKNPKLGPVTDNIDTVAEILFFYARFCQAGRLVVVHNDENRQLCRRYPRRLKITKKSPRLI